VFYRHGFDCGGAAHTFESNALEYLVLDYLKDKAARGSDIITGLGDRAWGFFSPSPGSVNQVLKMMADMGYVTVSANNGEKVYTITGEGKEYLEKRRKSFRGFGCGMEECLGGMEFAGSFRHDRGHFRWSMRA
jgi:DNA-binding PadR family transcriptional regulator